MFGMKNHFDISDSIEIRKVDIVGVTCIINSSDFSLAIYSNVLKIVYCLLIYIFFSSCFYSLY